MLLLLLALLVVFPNTLLPNTLLFVLEPPNKLDCGLMAENAVEPKTFLLALSSLGLLPSPLKKPPPLSVPAPNPAEDPNSEVSGLLVLVVENGEELAAELWPNTDPSLPLLNPELIVG